MSWLESGQAAMMQALDHGPAHLPIDLFAGSPARVLAGMKIHANTISHARLVALEDSFPRTRDLIGHDRFNAHSRLFLEQPGVTARPLAEIGLGFDGFMAEQGEKSGPVSLTLFELRWLASYHAADVEPLALAGLAGIEPDALMDLAVTRHPAASAELYDRCVHAIIGEEVSGLAAADAILIARPYSNVLISPATRPMVAILAAAKNPQMIGNLLAIASEQGSDSEDATGLAMQALVNLLDAGALSQVQSSELGK